MLHNRDLSIIMDAANWGLATAHAPDFTISAANDRMLQLLDTADTPITGKPWKQIFEPLLAPQDRDILEALLANTDKLAAHTVTTELKTGNQLTLRFAVTTDNVNEKSILISAHKTVREAVNSGVEEENYRRIFEEVQDYAILLLDLDGTILNWNRGAEKLKLYSAAEAIGKNFSMLYLPEDRELGTPQKLLKEARLTGRAASEGKRLRKDNTTFWASVTLTALHDDRGEVVGYSKVTRDLTKSKLAEHQLRTYAEALEHNNEALRKSEERYHSMISEVQDYAIILLDTDGYVLNWNIGAEKIKGYTAEEIVGKHFRQFYPAEDREKRAPEKLLAEALENGRALHEGWRVRKNGSRFWGSIVITLLHDANGAVSGFSKVTRDLTERKEAEDKMREYLAELEIQNRELENFAYIASHDLQEPLRKIQTFVGLIEKNTGNAAVVQRYFDKIKSSAQRMAELVRAVLNYSRLTGGYETRIPTNLNEVIENILSDFEILIEEKGAVINAGNMPVLTAMPTQMHQLFANLIGNGLKFSENKPVLTISSRIVPTASVQDVPGYTKGNELIEISVEDNGIGFDQQYEQVIFSMFQRLHGKQVYQGTGIGLAICKKIMESHSGFIRVTSTVGNGSTFRLYFPSSVLVAE